MVFALALGNFHVISPIATKYTNNWIKRFCSKTDERKLCMRMFETDIKDQMAAKVTNKRVAELADIR